MLDATAMQAISPALTVAADVCAPAIHPARTVNDDAIGGRGNDAQKFSFGGFFPARYACPDWGVFLFCQLHVSQLINVALSASLKRVSPFTSVGGGRWPDACAAVARRGRWWPECHCVERGVR